MQAKFGPECHQLSSAAAAVVAGSARSLLGSVLSPKSQVAQRGWTSLKGNISVTRNFDEKVMNCDPICVFRRGDRVPAVLEKIELYSKKGRYKARLRACSGLAWPSLVATPVTSRRVSSSSVARFTDGAKTEEGAASALNDFVFDGSRTTVVAHKVWQGVVRPGDTVIDATCGNGHDTLMLANMAIRDGTAGYVIGLDLQQSALDNTDALLNRELSAQQREKVSLLQLCHSQLGKVVDDKSVRLIVFNLGYQPGGDKSFITHSDTTVQAVAAASRALEQQGLISIMSYVGHPGGREEHEAVRAFVSGLPADEWVCSHFEWINRPLCPHLTFLLKR